MNHFLPILFEKLSLENNTTVLLGEFNANLLNYDIDRDISGFINSTYCNSLLRHIKSSTRITARSKTLIDNIVSNAYDSTFTSGNLLTTLSDHNAQFLFLENQIRTNKNIERQYYRDFNAMEKQNKKTYIQHTTIQGIKSNKNSIDYGVS